MKLFLLSDICQSGEACERCRDRERGVALREQWGRRYIRPKDWECPTKPWGWTKPYEIPSEFDPEVERDRMRQGGCCGKPSNPAG
jgi:hypothetical protein